MSSCSDQRVMVFFFQKAIRNKDKLSLARSPLSKPLKYSVRVGVNVPFVFKIA